MKRPATILALTAAGALSLALFSVSYQVQDLERELKELDRSIERDRKAIHVLKAEWSHLNDPRRLETLAERHLDLEPVAAHQVGTLAQLPPRPPEPPATDALEEEGPVQ